MANLDLVDWPDVFNEPGLDDDDFAPDSKDGMRHKCGVFGVYGRDDAAVLTALGLHALQHAFEMEIAAERELRTQLLPREQAFQIPDLIRTKINLLPEGISEVRTVEIVGLDLQADGGTHVNNTREVGQMKVVDYKSKGAINKRVYIELAE